jgi:menaquinone-dependent protoporphyrinogen oxidase
MTHKILLAYATLHGSTQAVAESIAPILREQGLTVELQPARKVRTLEGYQGVVLGASLYMFHMHGDALHFLSQHRKALTGGLPIAIFASGPIGAGEEKEWQDARKVLNQELAKFSWLKPVAVEVMGGKFDPATLRFPYNLIPALKQMPAVDLRNWEAIRRWAGTVAVQLQSMGAF